MENNKSKAVSWADAILSRHDYNAEARRFIDALGHSVPADGERREAAMRHLASLATELSDEACDVILYRLEGIGCPKWTSSEGNDEGSPYIFARGNPFWRNIKEMMMQKQRGEGQAQTSAVSAAPCSTDKQVSVFIEDTSAIPIEGVELCFETPYEDFCKCMAAGSMEGVVFKKNRKVIGRWFIHRIVREVCFCCDADSEEWKASIARSFGKPYDETFSNTNETSSNVWRTLKGISVCVEKDRGNFKKTR